jgi:hypothetical protein
MQNPCAREDSENDLRALGRASCKNEDEAKKEERINAGLSVAVGSKHAGDLRRIELLVRGAEPGRVLRVDRSLRFGAYRSAVRPKEEKIEAEHQTGRCVDHES